MKNFGLAATALVLGAACTANLPAATPPPLPANVTILQVQAPSAHPHLLPAYETAAEAATRGMADQYDDFRQANKQWYARTAPPKAGQFRSMAEWEPMSEVWTTYSQGMPQDKAVRRMYTEQSIAFAKVGQVRVIVPSTVESSDFAAALLQYGMAQSQIDAKVKFVVLPNNAIWHIDYGPLPLVDKTDNHLAFLDFVYYKNRTLDDAIPTRLAQDYFKNLTTYRMPFNYEGGNFQADGLGTCATSLRALKNTGYSELKVKNILKQYAGCQNTVIMKDITDDGTGHIDMFFKWLGPDSVMIGEYVAKMPVDFPGVGVVTVTMPDSIADALSSDFKVPYKQVWADNKQRMDDNAALWAGLTAPNGNKYKVFRLAMMNRFKDDYGDLPRTFVNSTLFNGVNVFPSYTLKSCRDPVGKACTDDLGCPAGSHCAAAKCTIGDVSEGCDEILACSNGQQCADDPLKKAMEAKVYTQWQAALPNYQHVGLRADTIALWSGAIHCITRTIPNLPMKKSIADGLCVSGTCGCSPGGSGQTCGGSDQCFGPQWLCDCNICKGVCGNGKTCTDDADCSADGVTVVTGACQIDAKQGCYGLAPGGGSGGTGPCGTVSFEGECAGAKLSYCDGALKTQTCASCCGWDPANSYYNCLTGAACSGCSNECQAGDKGCSSEATHAWTCVFAGGCLKRQYTFCASGCSAATAACAGGGGTGTLDKCPATDAGSTDAGTPDAGSTDTAPDIAPSDAVVADSAPADTAPPDVAPPDIAPPDVPPPDVTKEVTPDAVAVDAAKIDLPPDDTTTEPDTALPPDTAVEPSPDGAAPADDAQAPPDAGPTTDAGRAPRTDTAAATETATAETAGTGIGGAPDATTATANFAAQNNHPSACTASARPSGTVAALWALFSLFILAWRRRSV